MKHLIQICRLGLLVQIVASVQAQLEDLHLRFHGVHCVPGETSEQLKLL